MSFLLQKGNFGRLAVLYEGADVSAANSDCLALQPCHLSLIGSLKTNKLLSSGAEKPFFDLDLGSQGSRNSVLRVHQLPGFSGTAPVHLYIPVQERDLDLRLTFNVVWLSE